MAQQQNENAAQYVPFSWTQRDHALFTSDVSGGFSRDKSTLPRVSAEMEDGASEETRIKLAALMRYVLDEAPFNHETMLNPGETVRGVFAHMASGAAVEEADVRRKERDIMLALSDEALPVMAYQRPSLVLSSRGASLVSLAEQEAMDPQTRGEHVVPIVNRSTGLYVGQVPGRLETHLGKLDVSFPHMRSELGGMPLLELVQLTEDTFVMRATSYADDVMEAPELSAPAALVSAVFEVQADNEAQVRWGPLQEPRFMPPPAVTLVLLNQLLANDLRLHVYCQAARPAPVESGTPLYLDSVRTYTPETTPFNRHDRFARIVIKWWPGTASCYCSMHGDGEPIDGDGAAFLEMGCCGAPILAGGRCARGHSAPTTVHGNQLPATADNPESPTLKQALRDTPNVCPAKAYMRLYCSHSRPNGEAVGSGMQCPPHVIVGKPDAAERKKMSGEDHDPFNRLKNMPTVPRRLMHVMTNIIIAEREKAQLLRDEGQYARFVQRFLRIEEQIQNEHEEARAQALELAAAGNHQRLQEHELYRSYHTPTDNLAAIDRRVADGLRARGYKSQLKRKSNDTERYMSLIKCQKLSGGVMGQGRANRCEFTKEACGCYAHLFPPYDQKWCTKPEERTSRGKGRGGRGRGGRGERRVVEDDSDDGENGEADGAEAQPAEWN
jgi:hypothetical protein